MKVRILIPGRKVDDVSLREVRIRGFAFRASCVVSLTPILSTPPSSAMNSRCFMVVPPCFRPKDSISQYGRRLVPRDSFPPMSSIEMARPCSGQPSKLARGARPSMNFRPLWLGRNRNVGIWSRLSFLIMPVRQRGEQMIVDLESWEAGYDDGLRGRPSQSTPGLDRFSYSSGYFQARAYRYGTKEAPRYARSSTQRAAQRHGGSSRLIII